jgi:exonuclease SbcC
MKNLIEFIQIEGFQSQYNTRIDFSEGMTAFTGLSMDGKTAIMRAFEFVRKNRPTGFKFNYRYEDVPTRVSIGIGTHIITHVKSNKALNKEGHKALYIIESQDGEREEFSAYGTTVPEKVTELLNISDIAFQSQLDPYMLILSTSGQIATTINKITGIDSSDQWIKDINKALTGLKAEKTVLNNSQKNLAADVASYSGIDEIKAKILKAQELDYEYDKIIRDSNAILDLINVNSATSMKLDSVTGHLTTLQSLVNRLGTIDQEQASIGSKMALKAKYEISREVCDENIARYEQLCPKISLLQSADESIKSKKEIIGFRDFYYNQKLMLEACQNELNIEKDNLTDLLIEAGVCHLCGSELKDKRKIREAI